MADHRAGDRGLDRKPDPESAGSPFSAKDWAYLIKHLKRHDESADKAILPGLHINIPRVEREGGRVMAVTYKDGTQRQFGYDDSGRLTRVTQPDGTTWERSGSSNEWRSSTGKQFKGVIEVDQDGIYSYRGEDRVKKSFGIDGAQRATTADLGCADLKTLHRRYKDKIDTDKDGFITDLELNEAQAKLTGRHDYDRLDDNWLWAELLRKKGPADFVSLIGTLKLNFGGLKGLNNDQLGPETRISDKDIEAFDKLQKSALSEHALTSMMADKTMEAKLKQIDSNGDGFLTETELQNAAQNKAFSESERQLFEFMSARVSDIEEASDDEWGDENNGITLKDISAYPEKQLKTDEFKLAFDVDWSLNSYNETFGKFPWGASPLTVEQLAFDRNKKARFEAGKYTFLVAPMTALTALAGEVSPWAPWAAAVMALSIPLAWIDSHLKWKKHEEEVRKDRYEMWRRINTGH